MTQSKLSGAAFRQPHSSKRPAGRFFDRKWMVGARRLPAAISTTTYNTTLAALCITMLAGLLSPALSAAETSASVRLEKSLSCIAASEDTFNAVIALDVEGARRAAQAVDAGHAGGPLAGMPVLLKDNIETRDLPTTAGSLALAGNRSERDAALTAQLRAAGALILGKTNLSEWANFRSNHSSSGWSGIQGQTVNAIDPTRTPCGSSSGSAVAVARGYVPMAVGTETSGSIVCPAAINGVVGFKPTHGMISGEGIVPLALTQDTAGPIADSVETAARTLAVMAKPGESRSEAARAGLLDFAALTSFTGLRIGVWSASLGYDPRRDAALNEVIATLQAGGAEIVEGMSIERYPGFGEDSYKVLLYEFRRDIAKYLAETPDSVKVADLNDLIAFNHNHAQRELQIFDQSIFLDAQALEDSEADYLERLERIRTAMRNKGLEALFAEHDLDAIIGITGSLPWKIDPVNGDSWFGSGMASPAAIAGNPHITLPLAAIAGLPLGISLYGQRWADHKLAQIAWRLEQDHPKPHYRWRIHQPRAISPDCDKP